MPLGAMLRLANEGRPLVRCPACIHPCASASEGDEGCPVCGDLHMVTRDVADDWVLNACVPGPESA
jgi:hypothetical protein